MRHRLSTRPGTSHGSGPRPRVGNVSSGDVGGARFHVERRHRRGGSRRPMPESNGVDPNVPFGSGVEHACVCIGTSTVECGRRSIDVQKVVSKGCRWGDALRRRRRFDRLTARKSTTSAPVRARRRSWIDGASSAARGAHPSSIGAAAAISIVEVFVAAGVLASPRSPPATPSFEARPRPTGPTSPGLTGEGEASLIRSRPGDERAARWRRDRGGVGRRRPGRDPRWMPPVPSRTMTGIVRNESRCPFAVDHPLAGDRRGTRRRRDRRFGDGRGNADRPLPQRVQHRTVDDGVRPGCAGRKLLATARAHRLPAHLARRVGRRRRVRARHPAGVRGGRPPRRRGSARRGRRPLQAIPRARRSAHPSYTAVARNSRPRTNRARSWGAFRRKRPSSTSTPSSQTPVKPRFQVLGPRVHATDRRRRRTSALGRTPGRLWPDWPPPPAAPRTGPRPASAGVRPARGRRAVR